VVEFWDGIRVVYFKDVCKLQPFCTILSTVGCDTEMEGNHTPSQELLLLLFALRTAVNFPAISCPVSFLNTCHDSYFTLMLFTRQLLAKIDYLRISESYRSMVVFKNMPRNGSNNR